MKFVYSALLLGLLPLAQANAHEGFYLGAGVGVVGMEQDQSISFPSDGVTLTHDDSSEIGQIFAGYRFANNWGGGAGLSAVQE